MKEKWTEPKTTIEEFVPNEYIAACALTDKHEFILDPSLALATNTNVVIDADNNHLFDPLIDGPIKGTNSLNGSTGVTVKFIGFGWDVGNGNTQMSKLTKEEVEKGTYYAIVEQTGNNSRHGFSVAEKTWQERNMS